MIQGVNSVHSNTSNRKEKIMDISNYLKAGYPAISILTVETDRAVRSIICNNHERYSWDCMRGIIDVSKNQIIEDVPDPLGALRWLSARSDTVLFAENFSHFLESVEIIQEVQNSIPIWKASGCCFAITGPLARIPQEIEKYFTILDFELPGLDDLMAIQKELGDSVGVYTNPAAVEAALGLTEFESETAFALSLVEKKEFCADVITRQKMQMIKRSGLMEFWPPVPLDEVGGLDNFKQYLSNRMKAFEPGNENLPKPKALLLVGIPGTGKSLSCKAAASILNWPLIRLDISALKGSLVGESERRMRQATATIDAFGKAIVWLDEIEKAFAGVRSSGQTDGGTTSGMFGHFLTWMQETESPVIVMATANNINELPPEFLRAGRFDSMFFVDLPNAQERSEIIDIMNRRYGCELPSEFAEKLSGWTGAEIEQLAKDSLFDGLEIAFESIVPLSKSMKEEITAMQNWANTRARRANKTDETKETNVRRIACHT
jgi:AAA+ superfamily predicted ATPase